MELTLQSMKTLSELMDRALDLDSEARDRWLAELADGPHAALHPIVAQMIATRAGMDTAFLVQPSLSGSVTARRSFEGGAAVAGGRVGPYLLKRELGRGGMGAVWLAARDDGSLARDVALKLPALQVSEALGQRFNRERDILASLVHPNIARLYDAGVSAEGRPYLALEYIEGVAITEHADSAHLDVRQRLRQFLQVTTAVQYAHTHLVVHRDLKPANILVDRAGRVFLLDFGIAKLLDDPAGHAAETELTMLAGRALTLDFASPEQVAGRPVSTASDVYSLGVVLYLLLSGSKPHVVRRESRAALEESILSVEPVRMSEATTRTTADVAAARRSTPAALGRALAGDLDTIVGKCLKKDPAERYGTVAELAADIERFLEGQPVLAQPDSLGYRARKFVLRNRGSVLAGACTALALVTALGVALWQAGVAREEAARADESARVARNEQVRADAQAQAATAQSVRADREAALARDAAIRADQEAAAAAREALRADRESAVARGAAARADREARLARRESDRGNAVQGFLMDVFAANSNDQKNAIQVRNLTAKQLLDRGADRLEQSKAFTEDVNAALYKFFGELYETVYDYDRSLQMHERSVKAAAAAHGRQSTEYALALMEQAWILREKDQGTGSFALVEEAKRVLATSAPGSEAYAQALYFEGEFLALKSPQRALGAATESVRLLRALNPSSRKLAFAERARGYAQRALGDFDGAAISFDNAAQLFARLYGEDGMEVGMTLTLLAECYRQQLRIDLALETARRSVDIMRPYRGAVLDTDIAGQRLLRLTAEQGRVGDALRAAETAIAGIAGTDPAARNARAGMASLLAELAMAQGDLARAEAVAREQFASAQGASPLPRLFLALRLGRLALARGDREDAQRYWQEIDKVQQGRGLPADVALAVAGFAGELAAASGDREGSDAAYARAASAPSIAALSLASRLTFDMSRLRSAASLGDWPRVLRIGQPWLNGQIRPGIQIPLAARGELHLRMGEAAHRRGDANASNWLRAAVADLGRTDVANSSRLRLARELLNQ